MTDEVEPRGKLGIVEQDLDSLRATLGEDRRKKDSKKDAGAVLALRVQESERKKKKEKKRDRQGCAQEDNFQKEAGLQRGQQQL